MINIPSSPVQLPNRNSESEQFYYGYHWPQSTPDGPPSKPFMQSVPAHYQVTYQDQFGFFYPVLTSPMYAGLVVVDPVPLGYGDLTMCGLSLPLDLVYAQQHSVSLHVGMYTSFQQFQPMRLPIPPQHAAHALIQYQFLSTASGSSWQSAMTGSQGSLQYTSPQVYDTAFHMPADASHIHSNVAAPEISANKSRSVNWGFQGDVPTGRKGNGCSLRSTQRKTTLCPHYEATGWCPDGLLCRFAHGVDQFLARQSDYKTEFCQTLSRRGRCPYGADCHYLHPGDLCP